MVMPSLSLLLYVCVEPCAEQMDIMQEYCRYLDQNGTPLKPTDVHSVGGRNFASAQKELKETDNRAQMSRYVKLIAFKAQLPRNADPYIKFILTRFTTLEPLSAEYEQAVERCRIWCRNDRFSLRRNVQDVAYNIVENILQQEEAARMAGCTCGEKERAASAMAAAAVSAARAAVGRKSPQSCAAEHVAATSGHNADVTMLVEEGALDADADDGSGNTVTTDSTRTVSMADVASAAHTKDKECVFNQSACMCPRLAAELPSQDYVQRLMEQNQIGVDIIFTQSWKYLTAPLSKPSIDTLYEWCIAAVMIWIKFYYQSRREGFEQAHRDSGKAMENKRCIGKMYGLDYKLQGVHVHAFDGEEDTRAPAFAGHQFAPPPDDFDVDQYMELNGIIR